MCRALGMYTMYVCMITNNTPEYDGSTGKVVILLVSPFASDKLLVSRDRGSVDTLYILNRPCAIGKWFSW